MLERAIKFDLFAQTLFGITLILEYTYIWNIVLDNLNSDEYFSLQIRENGIWQLIHKTSIKFNEILFRLYYSNNFIQYSILKSRVLHDIMGHFWQVEPHSYASVNDEKVFFKK